MYVQNTKNGYGNGRTPLKNSNAYFPKIKLEINHLNNRDVVDNESVEGISEIDLPFLATANDLREGVKFFKNKPNGVSVIEVMNAEPRRVFDARKIAAYEFWGIISRNKDRLQLTALGQELGQNTKIECEIHRRILRSNPAYVNAIEWIYQKKLKIATHFDVAKFWKQAQSELNLSSQNEKNIEAIIVSFFSLCHAAELGTATVGKRGQPARLCVEIGQVQSFVEKPLEINALDIQSPEITRENVNHSDQTSNNNNIGCVYISSGTDSEVIEHLSEVLELADFESVALDAEVFENGFLPHSRLAAMQHCQAAIFLLDEKDCTKRNGKMLLNCDKITEISVARALYNHSVVVLWKSSQTPPKCFEQTDPNFFICENLDWETNVKMVKCLKNINN